MKPASWVEVRVLVPVGWEELVADVLATHPCTSVAYGAASLVGDPAPGGFEFLRTFFPKSEDSSELRTAIEERLGQLAERTGAAELDGLRVLFKELPAEDWANSWRKSWKPFRVGRLCVVTPDWEGELRPGDRRLDLIPGGAFGTGRHPTTRTCLAFLQETVRPGDRLLDAGSGSGILAVAAALLGASECLGFDTDPAAQPAATELAASNGVAERCRFLTAGFEGLTGRDSGYDLLVANLYADLVQAHASELAARLRSGGRFAFSGCLRDHLEATREAIAAVGLELSEVRLRGRWATLLGSRPKTCPDS